MDAWHYYTTVQKAGALCSFASSYSSSPPSSTTTSFFFSIFTGDHISIYLFCTHNHLFTNPEQDYNFPQSFECKSLPILQNIYFPKLFPSQIFHHICCTDAEWYLRVTCCPCTDLFALQADSGHVQWKINCT